MDRLSLYLTLATGPVTITGNARMQQRPSAHRTRLDSNIQGAIHQPVIAQFLCSITQRDHFRMGSRIPGRDRAIVTTPDHFVISHH